MQNFQSQDWRLFYLNVVMKIMDTLAVCYEVVLLNLMCLIQNGDADYGYKRVGMDLAKIFSNLHIIYQIISVYEKTIKVAGYIFCMTLGNIQNVRHSGYELAANRKGDCNDPMTNLTASFLLSPVGRVQGPRTSTSVFVLDLSFSRQEHQTPLNSRFFCAVGKLPFKLISKC